jgi:hypothetical protein
MDAKDVREGSEGHSRAEKQPGVTAAGWRMWNTSGAEIMEERRG